MPLALALLAAASCTRRMPEKARKPAEYVHETVLKTTPVKDQGASALCWLYGMLATIETNRLMMGDSVDLSPHYIARQYIAQQTLRSYLSRSSSAVSTRGIGAMALRLTALYGAQPNASYHPSKPVDYDMLCRTLAYKAKRASSLRACGEQADALLDEEIGFLPSSVFMYSMRYTPQEFGRSVVKEGQYEALTSFTHHPFGERFALEVPDNAFHDTFLNVPIDTLMAAITHAIRGGRAVCWEGDISSKGFSFEQGRAVLPGNRPQNITQESRQQAFESRQTTDDHVLELMGIARDKQGNPYFIAKNSWGKSNPYGGFMYLAFNYVRLNTIAVYLPRE